MTRMPIDAQLHPRTGLPTPLRCAVDRVRSLDTAAWRVLAYGAALLLLTGVAVLAYYHAPPVVQRDPDTVAYVAMAHRIASSGQFVDAARLPGYPLLLAVVFALAGQNNLQAVGAVQALLYVAAIGELYALLYLLLRRAGAACIVALLAGVNLVLISYVKPILTEALALFLLMSLALAAGLHLRRRTPGSLWVAAGWTLALFLTRPEWIYLPVPLFGYLLLAARGRANARRLVAHGVAAVALLYLALGGYVLANARINGYRGVSYIQSVNLLGKVMQYGMQGEAPPAYADVTRVVEKYTSRGNLDPWDVIRDDYTPVRDNYYARTNAYATAIIVRHPVEFIARSVPVAGYSLSRVYPFTPVRAPGWRAAWASVSAIALSTLMLFPLVALGWWLALLRGYRSPVAQTFGALALLGFYGLAITTLGGYVYYTRLHMPFNLILLATVWGTAAWVVVRLIERWRAAGAKG